MWRRPERFRDARGPASSHCLPAVCGKMVFTGEDLRSCKCDASSHRAEQILKAARDPPRTPKVRPRPDKKLALNASTFQPITYGLPNPRLLK